MTISRNFEAPYEHLDGASILVTGGTGSFGKAFVKKVLSSVTPKRLVVFSRDELKQYEMNQEFADYPNAKCLRFFIGDVRDYNRLEMAFKGIDYIFHAAALKHVPIAEYNPFECIHTNVLGTENVVRAALNNNIKKVVSLSTDKAASPINLYGASKLASDKIIVAANNLSGRDGTLFSVVRYGNVIGSRGSVVPLFKKIAASNTQKLPITDPRMTRFWLTLDQGVNFVNSCLTMMHGGEIFIPKIPSMKITDLAKAIAPDIEHEVIGIRPGEKLHEIMITEDDARSTIELSDRYVILPSLGFWFYNDNPHKNSKPVGEGFCYSSDSNTEWMGVDELSEITQ